MKGPLSFVLLASLSLAVCHTHGHEHIPGRRAPQPAAADPKFTINGIPFTTRAYWMRRANQALADLASPCPLYAFGTAIVNHTDTRGLGELICIGANNVSSGNPTLHGEMAAINNCSSILSDPNGSYRLSAGEVANAWPSLSLYTNAESCPMCATAIRWAGFKEYIYGTSIDKLIEKGFAQIRVSSMEIVRQSFDFPTSVRLIADVLANETDPYFSWQYDPSAPCPRGCKRVEGSCESGATNAGGHPKL